MDKIEISGDAFSAMQNDMADVKRSIAQIAGAMTRLALVEERQGTQVKMFERMMSRLEDLEAREHAVELRMAASSDPSRIERIENTLDDIRVKIAGYEGTGRGVMFGARSFWAIFGSAVSAGVIWLVTAFGGVGQPAVLPNMQGGQGQHQEQTTGGRQ